MLADVTNELIRYTRPKPAAGAEGEDAFLAEYRKRLDVGAAWSKIWRRVLNQLPTDRECPHQTGHVYAVEFESTLVKIGRTQNPRERITQHVYTARRDQDDVRSFWISVPHQNFDLTEVVLIDMCAERSTQIKKEYFAGLGYAAVIELLDQAVGAQIVISRESLS